MSDLFERATRQKLRFETIAGNISVEDVWSLPLSSGKVNLNDLAKALNKEIKTFEEEDFVNKTSNSKNEDIKLKFDIILHVIKYQTEQAEAKERATLTLEKRRSIQALIEKKESQQLENLSIEELKALAKGL
jgi:hypothetical protein